MKTDILYAASQSDLIRASEILKQGGLVAFPTETVYGLGALGLRSECVAKIYEAKQRPISNPMILHVPDLDSALPLWNRANMSPRIMARLEILAAEFWPGPLTIINRKSSLVPDILTAGANKVAVRVPSHKVAQELLQLVDEPIVAPSANLSGRPSATCAEHVLLTLEGRIDAVVDGGSCAVGLESTVVDISDDEVVVLRLGAISFEEIAEILPGDRFRNYVAAAAETASPGLLSKHYSPLIPTVTVGNLRDLENVWLKSDHALLIFQSTYDGLREKMGRRPNEIMSEVMPQNPDLYGSLLYSALYRMEKLAPEALILEMPHDHLTGRWSTILDRLNRASAIC